ncbi:hypothetical protein G6L37_06835 [Agrobacterium rubi]|nr:hypothetical protein [Agrobacterium rubi]NTF25080.1 hypothetical protein [Agrobacterium rubi]
MGCDIHLIAQRKARPDETGAAATEGSRGFIDVTGDFLDCRSYGLFGFLAGVRNYSGVAPISKPRGLPRDFHDGKHVFHDLDNDWGCHNHSWLSLEEMLEYDYDQEIEDRRVTRNGDGGHTADPGEGKTMSLREFLGDWYFSELERMKEEGVDRIVFCFDN